MRFHDILEILGDETKYRCKKWRERDVRSDEEECFEEDSFLTFHRGVALNLR